MSDGRDREYERESVYAVWRDEVGRRGQSRSHGCGEPAMAVGLMLNRRFGTKYGVDLRLEDSLAAALVDQNPGGQKTAMGGGSRSAQIPKRSALPFVCADT